MTKLKILFDDVMEDDEKKTFKDKALGFYDDAFDYVIDDNINSRDERDKIKSNKEIEDDEIDGEVKDKDPDASSDKKSDKFKTRDKTLLLTPDQHIKIEKSIFSKDNKEKRIIYKALLTHYNNLDTMNISEEFDNLKISKDNILDADLLRLFKYINGVYTRNKESLISEIVRELNNTKVTRKWVEMGSKSDKESLVKLMRYFNLNDNQIYNGFKKIDQPLTYNEILRFNIDLVQAYKKITKNDLEKFAYTLGKTKLKKLLLKLHDDIRNDISRR